MQVLRDEWLPMIPAKHVFLIVDACYGGLALRDVRATPRPTTLNDAHLAELTRRDRKIRQVLTAGGKDQRVLDGGLYGRSVFTGHLIQALREADPYTLADHVGALVRQRVARDTTDRGHPQTPTFGYAAGADGTFVFRRHDAKAPRRTIVSTDRSNGDRQSRAAALADPTDGCGEVDPSDEAEFDSIQLGHSSANCLAFSPNGELLAAGCGSGVRVWHLPAGMAMRDLEGFGGSVEAVAFSPDARMLAAGCESRNVRLVDMATDEVVFDLVGHTDAVNSVAFAPEGDLLASGSDDGTVRIWDVRTGRATGILGLTEPDPVRFGMARRPRLEPPYRVTLVAMLSGHDVLGCTDDWEKNVRFWTNRPLGSMQHYDSTWRHTSDLKEFHGERMDSFAIHRDAGVAGAEGRVVRVWDVRASTLVTLADHLDFVVSLAFSPDGTLLAAATADGVVRLWKRDTSAWTALRDVAGPGDRPTAVAFAPDGRSLAVGSSEGVCLVRLVAN